MSQLGLFADTPASAVNNQGPAVNSVPASVNADGSEMSNATMATGAAPQRAGGTGGAAPYLSPAQELEQQLLAQGCTLRRELHHEGVAADLPPPREHPRPSPAAVRAAWQKTYESSARDFELWRKAKQEAT